MSSTAQPAATPGPPCCAVIFTSRRTEGARGHGTMAERIATRAAAPPGFPGVESAPGAGRKKG